MIVIDSSVVIAIAQQEPETTRYVTTIQGSDVRLMSAASYMECAMVLIGSTGSRHSLDAWIEFFEVDVIPVDLEQARLAADTFGRYGKRRHLARLNYGDCFSYALAASRNAPLLYKGADFSRTDIRSALESLG